MRIVKPLRYPRLWLALGCTALMGCGAKPPPAPTGNQFVAEFQILDASEKPLSDPLQCKSEGEFGFRVHMLPQSQGIPATFGDRPVQPPEHWEADLRVTPDPAAPVQPEAVSNRPRFTPVGPALRRSRENHGLGFSFAGGKLVSKTLAPPKVLKPDWLYFAHEWAMQSPPGHYIYEIVVYPTADPPPGPGLMTLSRQLGEPVAIHTGRVEVLPPGKPEDSIPDHIKPLLQSGELRIK